MSSLLQIPTFINHENAIQFDKRPFTSVEEMNTKMRERWNDTVSTKDRVFILGDFIWLSPSDPEYIKFTKSLNGKKVLIRGNHDEVEKFPSELKKCFEDIQERKEIKLNKKRIIMDHFPLMFYKRNNALNVWHLYGHVHTSEHQTWVEKWTQELIGSASTGQMMNVGCMMPYMNYTPRTLDEIIEAWKEKYGWKA